MVRLQSPKPLIIVHISPNVTDFSASASLVLPRTMSVLAVSISVSVTRVSSVTDVVLR